MFFFGNNRILASRTPLQQLTACPNLPSDTDLSIGTNEKKIHRDE